MEPLEPPLMLATDVAGTLSGKQQRSGTIHITADLIIADTSKVTIDSGTVIKVDTGRRMTVRGELDTQATADDPIVFTSSRDGARGEDVSGKERDWEAIDFQTTATGFWRAINRRTAGPHLGSPHDCLRR